MVMDSKKDRNNDLENIVHPQDLEGLNMETPKGRR